MVAARWLFVPLLAGAAACGVPEYRPLVVEPAGGLPRDAFLRCETLLRARYQRLVVADPAAFRLQTDWVPHPDAGDDGASQMRATVFLQDRGVGCVVEARWLRLCWFDSVPAWSSPRADATLERELGTALEQVLGL
jgi:hypothetical protein